MSNKDFGKAVRDLVEDYGYDNLVITAVNSDNGDGATIIGGNDEQLIAIMAFSTLKDVVERFGLDPLIEGLEHFGREVKEESSDLDSADEHTKQEVLDALNEIKRKLGF